ncbi:carboxymuconolactone decarboxylase family protein [Aeromonas caviae]|uniref:carboxymuconolactone decarboxylase family protein n=1 Tax=Aeromonas caviae TaxID=648 RepID=UPI0029D71C18|nr:carboxymuconolactone decarboxylase family protein [Aeromonas caviae]MDX7710828.1 carboxymuconolactone decarboxylase family protein [Aeromonas caviae]
MSGSHTDRRERAFALLAQLDPQAPTRVAASLDALSPELAELVLGFAFADVLARPGIDLCTREMLTVATLMGMGTALGQLEFHIRAALNVGVSRETIIEILLQVAVYAGVPACMNGISAARSAFAAHDKGQGLRRRRHPDEKVRCALTRAERRGRGSLLSWCWPAQAPSGRGRRTLGLSWESMTPVRMRPPPSR